MAKRDIVYRVEFLLRFANEDRKNSEPYREKRDVELEREISSDAFAKRLAEHIAALNEFPVESVHVQLVSFAKKGEAELLPG